MPRDLTAEEQEKVARVQWERAEQLARRLANEPDPPAVLPAQHRGAVLAASNALASAIAANASEYELEAQVGVGVTDGEARVVTVELGEQRVLPVHPGATSWRLWHAEPGGAHGRLTELREPIAELDVPASGGWVSAATVLERLYTHHQQQS